MKKITLIILCFPLISLGQLNIGNNQTICLSDTAQIIATLSGPGTSGCTGGIDSLASDLGTSNGSNGTMFNIINTSTSDITLTGFSQGTFSYSGAREMNIWYYPGDYIPVMTTTTGWIQVATAVNINLPAGATTTSPLYSSIIPITSVVIPAGATYGFYVGANSTLTYSTATSGSISGLTPWGNNQFLTITVGHGGNFPSPTNTPRGPLVKVFYGGGATWYDTFSGQIIGSGDTLSYSPSQTTNIAAAFDCNGQTYSDTMQLEVLNTTITSSGNSLCNGPLVLNAQSGFSSYSWNPISSQSQQITVNNAGVYSVLCTTSNNQTCSSPLLTIHQDTIPISLSSPDSLFICQGDTVIIDGPQGYIQYNWNTGSTLPSISTTSTGNYSLNVTDGNGCIGVSNTTTIDISPQTITATTTGYSLCNGSVSLDAGPGFASYEWYRDGFLQWNGNTQIFTATLAGVWHCEVTYPTGCTATSNFITIVAGTTAFNVDISAIGSDTICEPLGQVILDAGNYASYLWNTGETTQQITANTIGLYSVDVIDTTGCPGSSNTDFEVHEDVVNTSPIIGPLNPTTYLPVNYSVLPTFGSTYNWTISTGAGTIQSGAGTNSIDVKWDFAGPFTVKVLETNIRGCQGDEIMSLCNILLSLDERLQKTKTLQIITNILGQEVNYNRKNTLLINKYNDGTVDKKIIIK